MTGDIMQRLKVDRRPLSLQAYQLLLEVIESGTYLPGQQLPSEADLADQLGISRPTLREALHKLEQDGIVVRKHGVGTFVSRHTLVLESGLEVLESLERQARRLGLNTEVIHLVVSERPATADECERLLLSGDEAVDVLDVERVIAIEGKPVAHLQDVVPLTYLHQADLGEHFSGSVLDLFLQQDTVLPVTSYTQINAEGANAQVAEELGIPPGTALLKLVGQLYSYDGAVLDCSISYFIPGHFKFHVTRRVDRGLP
jgi:GntR family transcriptional regulator